MTSDHQDCRRREIDLESDVADSGLDVPQHKGDWRGQLFDRRGDVNDQYRNVDKGVSETRVDVSAPFNVF